MNRRQFLKTAGLCGLSLTIPCFIPHRAAGANLPDTLVFEAPERMPQIIHVFLYGGPSELAGNLTNIADIAANSQIPYPVSLDPNRSANDITPNKFWGNAGGAIMEQMLADNQISIYRTIHRVKENSRTHGRCVAQNLAGHLDLSQAGMATTLAAIVEQYALFDKPADALLLPFVSFEGDSGVFSPGGLDIPVGLRPVNLDANFNNPYARSGNYCLDAGGNGLNDKVLDALARQVSARFPHFEKTNDAFRGRARLSNFIERRFNAEQVMADLPVDPDTGEKLVYPETVLGVRMRAAVSLAIKNPESIFISLGSGGLGGWDDHSNALNRYPGRFRGLMEVLQAAARHLALMAADNIVINVFGDFGRSVNLNNAAGWDHGNNQIFYTIGGAGIGGRTLGKLVGKTRCVGTLYKNRRFILPTDDAYQCEPFAIAATIFKYFGVQNPEVLTGEPAIDESDRVPNQRI